jgi:hypothetical protein
MFFVIYSIFARNRDMKVSYIPDWIKILVPDTHVWPEAMKDAKAAPFTADSTSASSNIKIGALHAVEM